MEEKGFDAFEVFSAEDLHRLREELEDKGLLLEDPKLLTGRGITAPLGDKGEKRSSYSVGYPGRLLKPPNKLGGAAASGVLGGVIPNGVSVWIKVLNRTDHFSNPVHIQDMARELKMILRTQEHPGIVKLLAVDWDHSKLVLERGTELEDVIASGELEEKPHTQQRYAEDITAALAYLHQLDPQIVHNDLKPSNCIVKPNSRCALIDFGISGIVGSVRVCRGLGGFVTPRKIERGEAMQTTNDIYALGRTLQMLLLHPALKSYHQQLLDECLEIDHSLRPCASKILESLRSIWAQPAPELVSEDEWDPRVVENAWLDRKFSITLSSNDKSPKGRRKAGIAREQLENSPERQAVKAVGIFAATGVTGACVVGAAAAMQEWQTMYSQGSPTGKAKSPIKSPGTKGKPPLPPRSPINRLPKKERWGNLDSAIKELESIDLGPSASRVGSGSSLKKGDASDDSIIVTSATRREEVGEFLEEVRARRESKSPKSLQSVADQPISPISYVSSPKSSNTGKKGEASSSALKEAGQSSALEEALGEAPGAVEPVVPISPKLMLAISELEGIVEEMRQDAGEWNYDVDTEPRAGK